MFLLEMGFVDLPSSSHTLEAVASGLADWGVWAGSMAEALFWLHFWDSQYSFPLFHPWPLGLLASFPPAPRHLAVSRNPCSQPLRGEVAYSWVNLGGLGRQQEWLVCVEPAAWSANQGSVPIVPCSISHSLSLS